MAADRTGKCGLVYASLEPYLRRHRQFTMADYSGAESAHHDLLEEALEHREVDEAYLFPEPDAELLSRRAVSELNSNLGSERVHLRGIGDLCEFTRSHNSVFVCRIAKFNTLRHFRTAFEASSVAVCAVVHAVSVSDVSLAYGPALLTGEAQDTLVVTSSSALIAVEAGLRQAAEFIAERLGVTPPQPRFRIAHIPLGVKDDFTPSFDKVAARTVLGLLKDETVLLYIGRLTDVNKADLEPLLLAFRKLAKSRPHVRLVIAGQDIVGQYKQRIEDVAVSMGIWHRVMLFPNFPHFAKPLLYCAADIFVSPVDNIQETFGLSLLEAMAMDMPVVASDWSGYRDIVVHGETGFLVPTYWNDRAAAACVAGEIGPFSQVREGERWMAMRTIVDVDVLTKHLEHLVDDRDLRIRFGQAGRKRVDSLFRWGGLIKQYGNLWREMSRAKRTQPATETTSHSQKVNAMFSHYATSALDLSKELTICENTLDILRHGGSRVLPSGPPGAEIKRLLNIWETDQTSFVSLSDQLRTETLDAMVWLLKKGYLKKSDGTRNKTAEHDLGAIL